MEPEDQRELDRQLDELTSELRVILPAVTVMFAFLLTLPFATEFRSLLPPQRAAYFVGLMSLAFALVLLVGESAYHRLRGRPYDKRKLIRTATHQAVGALALLLVATAAVVFLVTSVVYDIAVASVASGLTALAALMTWFVLPLWRRSRGE